MQVEVTEPEAYMYDGEYERKAAELDHPDLISIKQSNVSTACLCTFSDKPLPWLFLHCYQEKQFILCCWTFLIYAASAALYTT